MESSKSNRWHGGSCCEASLTWPPSGPCWPPLSTCAPCGGPGAPAPSSSYHTGQISIPLPDPNCAGNHPSPIHPHLQLSRQESFNKSHRLNPSAPTCYPLHHFWDRLNCELFGGPSQYEGRIVERYQVSRRVATTHTSPIQIAARHAAQSKCVSDGSRPIPG